jgi:hypothetical protein
MRLFRSCGWCHAENEIPADGRPVSCHKCGHRADTSRLACDCVRCVARLEDTLKPITSAVIPVKTESSIDP